MILLMLFQMLQAFAVEVIKPEFTKDITLTIVRAEPDSFSTYALMNHNGREMTLVCADNRVYDDNSKAFIEYRNFYNEIAARFTIDDNRICQDMGRFIELTSWGVSEANPFVITLSRKTESVKKIVYPKIDTLMDEGKLEDLLPKRPVYVRPEEKKVAPLPTVKHH